MDMKKIYVGNLSYNLKEDDLDALFSQYGNIQHIKVVTDFNTGRSKGFAFVEFDDDTAAQAALAQDGQEVDGRRVKVSIAREQQRRGGGGNHGNHQREAY